MMSLVLSSLWLLAKVTPQGDSTIPQQEIDRAIRRGSEFLKTAPSPGGHLNSTCDELILLTLIHAEVSESTYEPLLRKCLSAPLVYTYKVALLAMSLEEIDARRYQGKIAQCAQFLVDNQAANGQWSYGKPTEAVKAIPFEDKATASLDTNTHTPGVRYFGTKREHPKPKTSISVSQTRTVGEAGDNSNSQYAALGLRACYDANIKLPQDVLQKARGWWAQSQWADESSPVAGPGAVTSGSTPAPIRGWNYKKKGEAGTEEVPTLPMTAGAVGAAVIYEYLLGRDWQKDPVTRAGVNWIGEHFSIHENYYYLYGLERAGMLYGCDTFKGRNWYHEGARLLLGKQKPDGSWGDRKNPEENTWDTCFAILFLKKATRAIATEGGSRPK